MHTHRGSESLHLLTAEILRQTVCNHIAGVDVLQLYLAAGDFLSDIVFLDRYVLGSGMEFGIAGECDGVLVIAIDASLSCWVLDCGDDWFNGGGGIFGGRVGDIIQVCVLGNSLQFPEKSGYPYGFLRCLGKSHIFGFGRG